MQLPRSMDWETEKSGLGTMATLSAIVRFLPSLVKGSGIRRHSSTSLSPSAV